MAQNGRGWRRQTGGVPEQRHRLGGCFLGGMLEGPATAVVVGLCGQLSGSSWAVSAIGFGLITQGSCCP